MRSEPFMSFRFVVFQPETDEVIGATMVYSDPFNGAMWIGRAHLQGERTLGQRMNEIKKCEVWMFPRNVWLDDKKSDTHARKIEVSWTSMRWVPFDLDATKGEAALEYVCLEGATYRLVEDVHATEFPLPIVKAFSPKG